MKIGFGDLRLEVEPMGLAIALIILSSFVGLWLTQKKDPTMSFKHLIKTPDSNKLSLSRLGQLCALVVSTWGFIKLTVDGNLTEWYFMSYMMIWAVAEGFRKWGNVEINRTKIKEETKIEREKLHVEQDQLLSDSQARPSQGTARPVRSRPTEDVYDGEG